MTTLATSQKMLDRLVNSPVSGARSDAPGAVLLRVRELGGRDLSGSAQSANGERVGPASGPSLPPADDSLPGAAAENPITGDTGQAQEAAAEPNAERAASTQTPEADKEALASPASRQRRHREFKPASRKGFPGVWQGTVVLLLAALSVIVYLAIVRGGMRVDSAGNQAAGQTGGDDLKEPEISIPQPDFSPVAQNSGDSAIARSATSMEPEEASDDHDELFRSRSAPKPALAKPASAMPFSASPVAEATRETEFDADEESHLDVQQGTSPRDEVKSPRSRAETYPVTPAQATYPVTDPSRFRYPDDSRPSESAAGEREPVMAGGQSGFSPSPFKKR
jgi:hypothetical protein